MGILSERVKIARGRKGWKQMELARRVSAHRAKSGKAIVRQQSINQLEVGEVTSPRYLHDLAAVLEVNVEWLIGDDDVDPLSNNISRVPLISWVQAGELADAADPYYAGDAEDWVPIAHRHDNLIALRVRGDSMNKIAADGSIIIVDLNERDAVDGKHYVFRCDGRATFKTYRAGPPVKLEPQSYDPDFSDIFPEDGAEIVGLVIRKTEEI